MHRVWKDCVAGAFHGVVVWFIYGVVEFGFINLASFARQASPTSLTGWDWTFTLACTAIYVAFGAILGAGLGLLLPIPRAVLRLRRSEDQGWFLQAALVLSILLPYAFQIQNRAANSHITRITLATSLLLAVVLVASAIPRLRHRVVVWVSNPWTVTIALLGIPWWWQVVRQWEPPGLTVGTLALLALGIVGAAMAERLTLTNREAQVALPLRYAGAVATVSVLAAGVGLVLSATARPEFPELAGVPVPSGKPDILMVVFDTTRADHTSLHGYGRDTTPNVGKIALEATTYSNASASSNYTLPTHASLFTGLYSPAHGAHRDFRVWHQPLDTRFQTLAEIVAENGYLTGAVSANTAYVTPDWGMGQGFHVFRCHHLVSGEFNLRRGVRKLLQYSGIRPLERQYLGGENVSDEAIQMLDRMVEAKRPFFLFLNYMDPHSPLVAPRRFAEGFAETHHRISYGEQLVLVRQARDANVPIPESKLTSIMAEYDAGIAYADFSLGKVVEHLKRLGRYGNTVIVVTADHGSGMGEHGAFGHGRSVYQAEVGVPLVIKRPNQARHQVVSDPVNQVDILPSVLDAAGLTAPKNIHGTSLLRLEPNARRPVFSVSHPYRRGGDDPRAKGHRAVFLDHLKLMSGPATGIELYDLQSDHDEQINLFQENNSEAQRLLTSLDDWLAITALYKDRRREADEEAIERLRALGYVQ